MTHRVTPATAPYAAFAQERFDRLMPPGVPPLVLFTTLATDERLFDRFMNGGLLDRGHLTLRQRELVIDRVTAQCKSEYEWGVHTKLFAERVGFSNAQIGSIVRGDASDACWSDEGDRCLLRLCDALATSATLTDAEWAAARAQLKEHAIVEVLMLAGFYRMVSYLTNGLALPLESWAPRFSDYAP